MGTEWIYIVAIVGLVCFAGLMAGLTLGLMSLGLVDLEVLIKSGRPQDRIHAAKIFPVVKNQHLLLCTLLIGNALAMESLPIFLDKLVKPWAAIVISVTLILMFGEILPQAICTRYGMKVGAATAPVVRVLLILFFPVAYPISKVLDWMLGKGQSALLRRAELKTFVDFHGNEAGKGGDLSRDETTIIAGALELTGKTAKDAMTPIFKAFSLDLDGALDLQTLTSIMAKGHSRVPVYAGSPTNIIGLILVKNLLTIDPTDAVPLRKMTIRKIPRVSDHMPLYDILNEFQKGHSHIAVVIKDLSRPMEVKYVESKRKQKKHRVPSGKTAHMAEPNGVNHTTGLQTSGMKHDSRTGSTGENGYQWPDKRTLVALGSKKRHKGCSYCVLDVENSPIPEYSATEQVVGIITMEDVIEELLKEEILDETDEYVNIHNRIKINMQAPQEKATQTNSQEPLPAISIANASSPSSPMSNRHMLTQQSPISPREKATNKNSKEPVFTISFANTSSPTSTSNGHKITQQSPISPDQERPTNISSEEPLSTLSIANTSSLSSPSSGDKITKRSPFSPPQERATEINSEEPLPTISVASMSSPTSPTSDGHKITQQSPISSDQERPTSISSEEPLSTLSIANTSSLSPTSSGDKITKRSPFSPPQEKATEITAEEPLPTISVASISPPTSPTSGGHIITQQSPISPYQEKSTNINSEELLSSLWIANTSSPTSPSSSGDKVAQQSPFSPPREKPTSNNSEEPLSTLLTANTSTSSSMSVGETICQQSPFSPPQVKPTNINSEEPSSTLSIANMSSPASPTSSGGKITQQSPISRPQEKATEVNSEEPLPTISVGDMPSPTSPVSSERKITQQSPISPQLVIPGPTETPSLSTGTSLNSSPTRQSQDSDLTR